MYFFSSSFDFYLSQSHVNECVNVFVCAYFELNYMFIGVHCAYTHNSNRVLHTCVCVLSLLIFESFFCTTTVPIKRLKTLFLRNIILFVRWFIVSKIIFLRSISSLYIIYLCLTLCIFDISRYLLPSFALFIGRQMFFDHFMDSTLTYSHE